MIPIMRIQNFVSCSVDPFHTKLEEAMYYKNLK